MSYAHCWRSYCDCESAVFYFNLWRSVLLYNLSCPFTSISILTKSWLEKVKQNSRDKEVINKGNTKRGISPRLQIWPGDLDLWPWKSIGFQILLRTKYVPSLVKIHWRMLILECSQGCYGRTDGRTDNSVTISLRNFVGEGIIKFYIIGKSQIF
jgi:hypothetical protein